MIKKVIIEKFRQFLKIWVLMLNAGVLLLPLIHISVFYFTSRILQRQSPEEVVLWIFGLSLLALACAFRNIRWGWRRIMLMTALINVLPVGFILYDLLRPCKGWCFLMAGIGGALYGCVLTASLMSAGIATVFTKNS